MISLPHYLFFIAVFIFLSPVSVYSINKLDLCGGNDHIDSHALNTGSIPWNIAKRRGQEIHYIDISPCTIFKSNYRYFIPEDCKNSHICHNITVGQQTKTIGYQLENVITEFDTVRAVYTGPPCQNELNYTINIRYICGQHLGHPSFPIYDINTACITFLNWETSAACKNPKPTSNFGSNETKCYVIDDQYKLRDLTPLIKINGNYQVMADFDEELFINVCTGLDKCSDSSSCLKNKDGHLETMGSYKWSDIKFVPANEQIKHEYIELTYHMAVAKCSPNIATTKIRFICPKFFSGLLKSPIRKYPTLISNLDCEYVIEWITDYACPLEDIVKMNDNCQFEQIDLKQLNQTKFIYKNIGKLNNTIILNLCNGGSPPCSSTTSVCLFDGYTAKSIGSKFEAQFVKTENRLNMVFRSKQTTCQDSGNVKYEQTIVELECDNSASLNSIPKFIEYSSCQYKFHWLTPIVCPLFEDLSLNCTYINMDQKNHLIQVDLSSLRLDTSHYTVHRDHRFPSRKYSLHFSQEIQFNVCDNIPFSTNECHHSAACLIDKAKNTSFTLGYFMQPLTYNENTNSFELVYTGGFDPFLNRQVSTKIIFLCQSYDSEVYLIDFDEKESQYIIEFHSIAACPLHRIKGKDCIVKDPITGNIFDLRPLKSLSYYVIRNDDHEYEFELNVCSPVIGGSCSAESAICQKELNGDHRNFSLGAYTDSIIYWNSMLNMTFTNGDRYNDKNRTPRKSHISFICDPSSGKGHPEFIGEFNRSYSFIWYTSLACLGSIPKKSHCVYENETHFIDFNPLSLERGNHFVLDDNNSIIYINFCRSLNKMRDNLLKKCKSNSAICTVKNLDSPVTINLGEPSDPPLMGFDGNIYMFYNNGDPCPHDPALSWTTSFQFQCENESGQDLNIIKVDPNNRHQCTYEFIVQTPIACPQKLIDVTLENCIYMDKRTNLSADLSSLSGQIDYEITTKKKNAIFFLNICKPVHSVHGDECDATSAVCFRNSDQSLVNYGKMDKLKIYFDDNLHLRYSGGTECDNFSKRKRSADIELICDPQAHFSQPILSYYDECLVKFYWKTSVVCSLKIPSCSLFDNDGNYYSLRQLSSLSHAWKVDSSNPNEHYLINVCKPLPPPNDCGSAAVCKCTVDNGGTNCKTSVGKVSDHEIWLNPITKHLILSYEENEPNCNGKPLRTQIQFQCTNESNIMGPKFINVNDCTHYFVWNTSFACPHNLQKNNEFILDKNFYLHDEENKMKWDLHKLLAHGLSVPEKRVRTDHIEDYNYEFKFTDVVSSSHEHCSKAAICQTNTQGLYRDIGTLYNWKFIMDDVALHMIIQSNNSRCGRNPSKFATTKIFFECVDFIESKVSFLYESDDCEYYFLWKTFYVCSLNKSSDYQNASPPHKSSIIFPLILLIIVFCCLAFFIHEYYHRINFRDFICRLGRFRGRSTTTDVNFRYQQLSLWF